MRLTTLKMMIVFVAVFAVALSFGVAYAGNWTYAGCWSPYPNCVGAKDVYVDGNGDYWQCGACGTTTNPNPGNCYLSGDLGAIGYWCPLSES